MDGTGAWRPGGTSAARSCALAVQCLHRVGPSSLCYEVDQRVRHRTGAARRLGRVTTVDGPRHSQRDGTGEPRIGWDRFAGGTMTTRDPERALVVHKRELTSSAARNISTQAILSLVPVAQRLEVAAMLLADEVRRLNDPSIAPPLPPDGKRLSAMADVIRSTSALRQRLAEFPRTGNVDGVSIGYALTERQDQILKLVLFGLSEKAIAERMGLSRHTVHEHIKAIHRRLVVNSRAELMARCLREGFANQTGHASGEELPPSLISNTAPR
ncbi:MAG: response regulator transcription factor [Anaerolineae bacterium]|nr:response regulator transcription factor [Phycisphaerae bacterium]